MPRPSKDIKRDRQLNIALDDDELVTLRARADTAGMRLVDFARAVLLGHEIIITTAYVPTAVDRLAFEQLKRIGNNLNQVARQLNAMEAVAVPDLEVLLRDLRDLIGGMVGHDR